MTAFVVGTSAELIKVAPVWREMRRRGQRPVVLHTSMHVAGITQLAEELELELEWVSRHPGVRRSADVPGWAVAGLIGLLRRRRVLREAGVVVVHGDTFTTLVGALVGRMLRLPVVHLEAGLRSGSLLSPFPEEINRRLVGRLAQLHLAPSERDAANLAGRDVVVTDGNTVVEELRRALGAGAELPTELPASYGLVTLHRFELVSDAERYRAALRAGGRVARREPVVVLLGASDSARVEELGLAGELAAAVVLPKMGHRQFSAVLASASWVVTDSGGLQEECSYLGTPCLVYRSHTERDAGLGKNVVLSEMRAEAIEEFLECREQLRRARSLDGRPSRQVVDALEERGMIGGGLHGS